MATFNKTTGNIQFYKWEELMYLLTPVSKTLEMRREGERSIREI